MRWELTSAAAGMAKEGINPSWRGLKKRDVKIVEFSQ
jgi:hypothetical protein